MKRGRKGVRGGGWGGWSSGPAEQQPQQDPPPPLMCSLATARRLHPRLHPVSTHCDPRLVATHQVALRGDPTRASHCVRGSRRSCRSTPPSPPHMHPPARPLTPIRTTPARTLPQNDVDWPLDWAPQVTSSFLSFPHPVPFARLPPPQAQSPSLDISQYAAFPPTPDAPLAQDPLQSARRRVGVEEPHHNNEDFLPLRSGLVHFLTRW
jgi:hypothetical protein